jgi:hypothetical protein
MKKVAIAILFIFIIIPINSFSNNPDPKDKVYYWFYVKLGEVYDKETETTRLKIKKLGKEILSGTFGEFIHSHKAGLKTGKIFIGPFNDLNRALQAKKEYETARNQSEKIEQILSKNKKDTIFYFYLTRPVMGKWFNPVNFEHIPARISPGTTLDFQAMLTEGFTFRFLAVGPFSDYGMAEKSKFIFRKNGETQISEVPDSVSKSEILSMDKKWKTLKIEIARLASRKNKENQSLRVKIKFPKQYFSENVFQTITFRARYSDPAIDQHTGITLQGELAPDNNPAIPFDKATTYTQLIEFPVFKKYKLEGIYIESFIFNTSDMVEQENRYQKVR